jgi:hypothetical protein
MQVIEQAYMWFARSDDTGWESNAVERAASAIAGMALKGFLVLQGSFQAFCVLFFSALKDFDASTAFDSHPLRHLAPVSQTAFDFYASAKKPLAGGFVLLKCLIRNKCKFWQAEPDAVQGSECVAVRALQAGPTQRRAVLAAKNLWTSTQSFRCNCCSRRRYTTSNKLRNSSNGRDPRFRIA